MCTVLNETAGIDALEVSKLHHIRLLDIMMNIIFWLNLKESGKWSTMIVAKKDVESPKYKINGFCIGTVQ